MERVSPTSQFRESLDFGVVHGTLVSQKISFARLLKERRYWSGNCVRFQHLLYGDEPREAPRATKTVREAAWLARPTNSVKGGPHGNRTTIYDR
jgi:hypothetical protein